MTDFLLKAQEPDDKPKVRALSTVTAQNLNELSVADELLAQFKEAKDLLEEVRTDESVPANQKAQIINSTTGILRQIVSLQQEVQNIENLKILENTLIEVLKKHPTLKDAFIEDYKKALGKKVKQ